MMLRVWILQSSLGAFLAKLSRKFRVLLIRTGSTDYWTAPCLRFALCTAFSMSGSARRIETIAGGIPADRRSTALWLSVVILSRAI
jgi:hypothetical protein